jgi:hypothetical protein
MTLATEVSLNSETKVLLKDGSAIRNMVGSRTWARRCTGVRPIALPASSRPLGTASSPARNTSTR